MRNILAAFLLATIAASSHAASLCDRDSANTLAINACSEDDFKAAESRLNKVYKRAISLLSSDSDVDSYSAETKKYLIAAQRAWVVFRENDCLAGDTASGNATLRTEYFGCMQQHAESRTKQLLEYVGR